MRVCWTVRPPRPFCNLQSLFLRPCASSQATIAKELFQLTRAQGSLQSQISPSHDCKQIPRHAGWFRVPIQSPDLRSAPALASLAASTAVTKGDKAQPLPLQSSSLVAVTPLSAAGYSPLETSHTKPIQSGVRAGEAAMNPVGARGRQGETGRERRDRRERGEGRKETGMETERKAGREGQRGRKEERRG